VDTIRYSNCWEDASVLLQAMNPKKGGVYLSIASAGDNTLAILSQEPSLVLAADISPAQIACLELRKAAFASFTREKVLEFLGINRNTHRIASYKRIRNLLSKDSRYFWDRNHSLIRTGIIHVGRVERYFRLFRRLGLPFLLSNRARRDLLKEKNSAERIDFYRKNVNSWRWKVFLNILFNRHVMRRLDLGREPGFYDSVRTDIADYVIGRTEYAMTTLPTHNNPYLEYIVRGNFKKALPFYLLKENFDRIRNNLDKLEIFQGSLTKALRSSRTPRFDAFNLSDIFECMTSEQHRAALELIIGRSKKNTRLVYWTNLKNREPSPFFNDRLIPLDDIAQDLYSKSSAFFYRSLVIREVR